MDTYTCLKYFAHVKFLHLVPVGYHLDQIHHLLCEFVCISNVFQIRNN